MGSSKGFSSFFLFALVFTLGCTGSTDENAGAVSTSEGVYGLVLEELRTDVGLVEEGDIITLTMTVTNVDQQEAKNIKAKIYPVGLSPVGSSTYSISSIESNNTDFFEFDMKAPTLNVDRIFTPYSVLCYDYRSTATTTNFVVDNDLYDLESVPTLSKTSSSGPVTMGLSFSSGVLKIISSEDRQKTLSVKLSNVDTGYVINSLGDVLPGTGIVKDKVQPRALLLKIPATASVGIRIDNDDSSNSFDCAVGDKDSNIPVAPIGKITNFDVKCSPDDSVSNGNCCPTGTSTYSVSGDVAGCCPGSEIIEIIDSEGVCEGGGDPVDANDSLFKDTLSNFKDVICTNIEEISFGSRGEGRTLRLPLTFDIVAGEQDVPFFIAEIDYRYCLQSNQLTVQAKKFS